MSMTKTARQSPFGALRDCISPRRSLLLAGAAAVALLSARPAHAGECPADAVRADVAIAGPDAHIGVEVVNGPAIPLARSTGLDGVLQYRRVTIAPGGTLQLHAHASQPGYAQVLTGVAIEFRSDCSVPIVRRAGDIVTEPDSLSHWWRNEGETPVVLIVSHVVPAAPAEAENR